MGYKIKLELFEGPLDLLLYLVKKDHLNIYDIPIAQVTEQYIAYLDLMKFLDLGVAGEFLVMASTLLHIKSKMLLPAEEITEEEPQEDPRDELVRQLLEYERFKEIAKELRQREQDQKEVFKRTSAADVKDLPAEQPQYFEASIFDLISAFSKALEETPKDFFYNIIKDEFTIEEKVHALLHLLIIRESVPLSELFGVAKNKIETIVTFLAILELIRMKEIIAFQSEMFGEIEVRRNLRNVMPHDGQDTAN